MTKETLDYIDFTYVPSNLEQFKRDLDAALNTEVVKVTFIKSDGTERVMFATRLPNYLPESNGGSSKKVNPDVAVVWSVNDNGWRSFRYDSVSEYEVSL